MSNEVVLAKDEQWSRQSPAWKISFPVHLEDFGALDIKVPGLDLKVEVDYIMASVAVLGKRDAERVAKRIRAILEKQNIEEVD